MTNYVYWRDEDDESIPAPLPGLVALQNVLVAGKGKAMPVVSIDGNVAFLTPNKDKNESLFDRKLGVVLQGSVVNTAAVLRQPIKHFMGSHRAELEGQYVLASPRHPKNCIYVGYSSKAEDEARRQILEAVSRKGVAVVAPTTSVGLPVPLVQQSCAPELKVQSLLDRIKVLEGQVKSNLPYAQMYKFGAGSLLIAVLSLIVWAFTGAGVPFHPVFAAMVIPAAIGLMIMAFLVRREALNAPKVDNR